MSASIVRFDPFPSLPRGMERVSERRDEGWEALKAQAVKVLEEASELQVAACAWMLGELSGGGDRRQMLLERADLGQALANFDAAFGIGAVELAEAAVEVGRKNREAGRL